MRGIVMALLLVGVAVDGPRALAGDPPASVVHGRCVSYGRLVQCFLDGAEDMRVAPFWLLHTHPSEGGYGDHFQLLVTPRRLRQWTPITVETVDTDGATRVACMVEARYAGDHVTFRLCPAGKQK